MAVEKNEEKNITYNSEIVGKIGLSKTINNYTAEELWNFALCTSQWDFMQNFKNCNVVYNDVAIGINSNRENFPIYYSGSANPSQSYAGIKYDKGVQNYNNSEGVYARVIWLQKNESGNFKRSITNTANGYKIITNCDWNKVLWDVQSGYEINGWDVSGDEWHGIKSPFFRLKYLVNGEYITVSALNDIAPYIMFKIDNNICIYQVYGGLNTQHHYHLYVGRSSEIWAKSYGDILTGVQEWVDSSQISSFDGNNHYVLSLNLKSSLYTTKYYDFPYEYNIYAGVYGGGWSGCYETDIVGIGAYIDSPKENKSGGIFYAPCNKETYRLLCSLYGVMFLDDKIYKPIIKDGYVTGYTDNLSEKSDIDNYNYESGMSHKVPDSKPIPNDVDSESDMDIGSLYSASGMVRYYKVTSENLQMLSKLMSNVDVVGTKNLLPNLISLKAFPIPFDRLGRGVAKTIEIGGVEMTDSIAGTAQGITVDSTYNFLTCCDTTIQGKYGNISSPHFLDFSPYTQVELILPLAGSVILPDNAMYKSLNVVYVYDIVNGSAICVVKSNGTVIATIPCTLSQDIPFSATNVGAKTSAMVSNITNVSQNVATLGVSMGTGNVVGAISSGIGTVGSIAQSVMSNNQNYMEKFGRNGDMCDFGLVKKAYIKYTRPIDIIPENFGRTNGYLCNVTKKLSDCNGFTVCDNVDINVSATNTEKRMIKQLLETGIYI